MRGEHMKSASSACGLPGSPPHARGTRGRSPGALRQSGIIPACAGNTLRDSRLPERLEDHPRMRGEHSSSSSSCSCTRGTSPHARGTLEVGGAGKGRPGIIPACAGNTPSRTRRPSCGRDHPRMRGEHNSDSHRRNLLAGSSPHARGTHRAGVRLYRTVGIIPACAGNTRPYPSRSSPWRDHPRMRGEHMARTPTSAASTGSSPHARGTLEFAFVSVGCAGVIPACAGNTSPPDTACPRWWDHPRMRGEHCSGFAGSPTIAGSSPHARGTLVKVVQQLAIAGIIPACAGNTQ